MSMDICSSRQCNICLLFEMENAPSVYKNDETAPTGINLKQNSLSRCNGCQLVLYCNAKHQKMDWPLHRDFCRAAQKLMSTYNVKHPFLISGQPKNAEDMERTILQVKFVLRSLLDRLFHYQEEELTSYPQYCEVCYNFRRLRTCARCQGVSYCSEAHAQQDLAKHKRKCGLLQLYYTPYKGLMLPPSTFEFFRRVSDLHKTDLYEAFRRATLKKLPPQPTASLEEYQLFTTVADFSCIGTICYVLGFTEMRCYDNSKFVIFIVGAVFEQELWFRDIHTQFFFLQFPQISMLYLFFIGPEVEGPETKEVVYLFQGQQRCVQIVTYRGLFQDFSKEFNIKPSFIISFNCGFSENMGAFQKNANANIYTCAVADNEPADADATEFSNKESSEPNDTKTMAGPKDTWTLGILDMLLTFDVPIVFTSYNSMEAHFDYATLLRIAQSEKQPIYVSRIFNVKKNPFRDLRPLRHWRLCDEDDDGIFYRNGYVQAVRTRFES